LLDRFVAAACRVLRSSSKRHALTETAHGLSRSITINETAHGLSRSITINYSLFTVHSSLRRCQAPFLVEAARVELASENRSTRLSTRLAGLFYLPRDSPNGRIVLWQLFGYEKGYRALTRRVGCCVTPRPKPQHSSAGRAALRQLMQVY